MHNLKTKAISRINDYIEYIKTFKPGPINKRELYSACCGKIHLAFDLELITKEEKHELLQRAANSIV